MNHSPQSIHETILKLLQQRDDNKSLAPDEVARALAGTNEKEWRLFMKPIRHEAVTMANEGEINILRKGKIVSPIDFKGIYRLALPQENS
ncbi:MAG: DUF3253 domain-containing protein [Rhizobiaceae bacterium]